MRKLALSALLLILLAATALFGATAVHDYRTYSDEASTAKELLSSMQVALQAAKDSPDDPSGASRFRALESNFTITQRHADELWNSVKTFGGLTVLAAAAAVFAGLSLYRNRKGGRTTTDGRAPK